MDNCQLSDCQGESFLELYGATPARKGREVRHEPRIRNTRWPCLTSRQNRSKDAVKREQSDARISSAEREYLRWQKMPPIDAENRPKSRAEIWNIAKIVVPLQC